MEGVVALDCFNLHLDTRPVLAKKGFTVIESQKKEALRSDHGPPRSVKSHKMFCSFVLKECNNVMWPHTSEFWGMIGAHHCEPFLYF